MDHRLDDYLDKQDRYAIEDGEQEDMTWAAVSNRDESLPGPWDDLPEWERQRFEALLGVER